MGYFHYPLGQEWYCQLNLEKVLSRDKEQAYPVCVGGERMAPPVFSKHSAKLARLMVNPQCWGHKRVVKTVNRFCNRDVFDKDKVVFSDPGTVLDAFYEQSELKQRDILHVD